jgi:hypothetical protein
MLPMTASRRNARLRVALETRTLMILVVIRRGVRLSELPELDLIGRVLLEVATLLVEISRHSAEPLVLLLKPVLVVKVCGASSAVATPASGPCHAALVLRLGPSNMSSLAPTLKA